MKPGNSDENQIPCSRRLLAEEALVNDFEKGLVGLKQVLGYLEDHGKDSHAFALEAERARLIIAAIEARQGVEARRLIELPLEGNYGGTGWQYIVSLGRELAQRLIESKDHGQSV
jgi:hypothetical protein